MFDIASYFAEFICFSVLLLPLYLVVKERWRYHLLIAAGIWMLYLAAPRLIFFYIPYWLIIWGCHRLLTVAKQWRYRKAVFLSMIVLTLAPMVIWKLFPELFLVKVNLGLHHVLWGLSQRAGEFDAVRHAIIPIGLSFNTFRAIDLLVQSYLELVSRLPLRKVLFYGLFPPVMATGPIIEFNEVAISQSGDTRETAISHIGIGCGRILIGFVKIFILAAPLEISKKIITGYHHPDVTPLLGWLGLFLYTWYFYFNFAGYSDLAIGTARLYGFKLRENFNNPYFKPNIQLFWANWHMSLSRFAQRNVFVPLGGYRVKKQYIAIFGTMMVIAFWHDLNLSMLIFGLWHTAGLCINRYLASHRKAPTESIWRHWLNILLTFIFFMLSIPFLIQPLDKVVGLYKLLLWM